MGYRSVVQGKPGSVLILGTVLPDVFTSVRGADDGPMCIKQIPAVNENEVMNVYLSLLK